MSPHQSRCPINWEAFLQASLGKPYIIYIYVQIFNSSKFQSRCPIGVEHVLRVGAPPVYIYIYIWANSSKFQSVPLATSTSCESVPCTPVYSRLNTFFNQDVPLAKSTSCGTVPCTPLWFLQISIKMSHWRRVRLTGRCHAGTSSKT